MSEVHSVNSIRDEKENEGKAKVLEQMQDAKNKRS